MGVIGDKDDDDEDHGEDDGEDDGDNDDDDEWAEAALVWCRRILPQL